LDGVAEIALRRARHKASTCAIQYRHSQKQVCPHTFCAQTVRGGAVYLLQVDLCSEQRDDNRVPSSDRNLTVSYALSCRMSPKSRW
ncbi:unnamed protein product, partial [Trichogramma brassicae]